MVLSKLLLRSSIVQILIIRSIKDIYKNILILRNIKDIIELLHKIGNLKDLDRKGWVLKKVPNPESVADHSFRTSIMALLLSEKFGLDKNKCIQMALIHDISESLTGDITSHDNISDEEKHKLEKSAMKSLFKNVDGNNIVELWDEYEKRESPEAKFIYELDKIETLLQAFEYERKYKDKKIDLSEFWIYIEKKIKDQKLLEILNILKKNRSVASP